jgi:hypothetical protein
LILFLECDLLVPRIAVKEIEEYTTRRRVDDLIDAQ